ncbi:hypothetical protein LTR22_027279 [Elasticomyces elasticus]|nr:hypothetical protein LTR22_027279 [Elasticomyces elasticus]
MFGRRNGVSRSAGPLHTDAAMAQATSDIEWDSVRYLPSCSILGKDAIMIEEEPSSEVYASRPDSWSIHCDRTDQAPYVPAKDIGNMMTSTSLFGLPQNNDSAQLAFFLKTTGPSAPHRRPTKVEESKPGVDAPKKVLQFFKLRLKRSKKTCPGAHQTFDREPMLRDEGGLLMTSAEQRQTSSGMWRCRYLHVIPKSMEDDPVDGSVRPLVRLEEDKKNETLLLSPDTLDSTVDIAIIEVDIRASLAFDNDWLSTIGSSYSCPIDDCTPQRESLEHLPLGKDMTVQVVDYSSPVRPRASNPPTPQLRTATWMAEWYRSDLPEHPAKRSIHESCALSSYPANMVPGVTALPKIPLLKEEFPVTLPGALREVDIKHPSPRRFASHPVLLQRAPSIASLLHPRSFSNSPGPPPPRNPLRLRRDSCTTEGIITTHISTQSRTTTPKMAPTIDSLAKSSSEYNDALTAMESNIITDRISPIKRQRSRGRIGGVHHACPLSCKEREERIRPRKLRDRTYTPGVINATVNAAPLPALAGQSRKPRPQLQIPRLEPAPLDIRASSSASSTAGWKKITDCTRTPVPPVPSQDRSVSISEKTGYTPVSPTTINGSKTADSCMAISPVMLVAEEMPAPRTRSMSKPVRLVTRFGECYAPRPRSASVPPDALLRRSRTGSHTPVAQQTSSRSVSPLVPVLMEDTPLVPCPPPNRALPPTPPALGFEKPARLRLSEAEKILSIPPLSDMLPRQPEVVPHVFTQVQRKSISPEGPDTTASKMMDARLIALEKQNEMLSAALVAVLRTNRHDWGG